MCIPLLTDDELKEDRLDPMAISVLLHAHCGQPIYATRDVKIAVKKLLRDKFIFRTGNNGACPYANYAIAHDLVLKILNMPKE